MNKIMTRKDSAKDIILKVLLEKGFIWSEDLLGSTRLEDGNLVEVVCRELEQDDYLIAHFSEEGPFLLRSTSEGDEFIKEGGYAALDKKASLGNVGRRVTIWAPIIIALVALIPSFWAVYQTDKSDKLEKKL